MNSAFHRFREAKRNGEKVAVLTAYDYPTARLLAESGVDLLLVGDSLGMVVLGYPDTTHVTMEHMLHHTEAVVRGAGEVPIVADLPIASYDTPEQAVLNARRLLNAGAHSVKLEGGSSHAPQIRALTEANIPMMAHIGMLPQHVKEEGGYKIKGKTAEEADRLLADALAVQAAGAWAMVLELVRPEVAAEISATIDVPTIGIGAGSNCDGQVLVIHDLVGLFPWFTPKFVKSRAHAGDEIRRAATEFVRSVKSSSSPG